MHLRAVEHPRASVDRLKLRFDINHRCLKFQISRELQESIVSTMKIQSTNT